MAGSIKKFCNIRMFTNNHVITRMYTTGEHNRRTIEFSISKILLNFWNLMNLSVMCVE